MLLTKSGSMDNISQLRDAWTAQRSRHPKQKRKGRFIVQTSMVKINENFEKTVEEAD